jgi:hypothetical protein
MSLFNEYLKKSVFFFRCGNIPQSELLARKAFQLEPTSDVCQLLLKKIYLAYGLSIDFTLNEKKNISNSTQKKYLLIKAWGYGFWSEIHYLLNLLLIAEFLNRTPIVLWGKNCLYRNMTDIDAFEHFFQKISDTKLDDLDRSLTLFPSKWSWDNIYEEDNSKWSGKDSRMAVQKFFSRDEDVLVADFYSTLDSIIPWIDQDSTYFNKTEDLIYLELFKKYLTPSDIVLLQVEKFFEKNMSGKYWLAVHIRGGDKVYESSGLEQTNKTVNNYVELILKKNPFLCIFLLTDSASSADAFKAKYGDRVLTTQSTRTNSSQGVHNNGENDGIQMGFEVLLDVLLAVKCNFFVGNIESNVSLAISSLKRWSNGTLFLAGFANVRGENTALHAWPELSSTFSALGEALGDQPSKLTKRVVQVFKPPSRWKNSPPGIGDFIRGCVHLFEILKDSTTEFRIDLSLTEFDSLIEFNPSVFQRGEIDRIVGAEEHFTDHDVLMRRIVEFSKSSEEYLYISTNLGFWGRLEISDEAKEFVKNLYSFNEKVKSVYKAQLLYLHQTQQFQNLKDLDYQVISIRCGDQFYANPSQAVQSQTESVIEKIIEGYVLPRRELRMLPVIVTSDSYYLKLTLAKKYNFMMLEHKSEHGASGNVLPVLVDLELLKNSKFNFHINCWASWWSGFSHYTSRIFDIPSMNFRAPDFDKEEILATGELIK